MKLIYLVVPPPESEYLSPRPLSQNSCRLDRNRMNRGEDSRGKSGSIRTSLQRQRGGEVATAGKCQFAAGLAAVLTQRFLHRSGR